MVVGLQRCGVSHRSSVCVGGERSVTGCKDYGEPIGNIHPGCHGEGGREGRQDWKRFWVFDFFFFEMGSWGPCYTACP